MGKTSKWREEDFMWVWNKKMAVLEREDRNLIISLPSPNIIQSGRIPLSPEM